MAALIRRFALIYLGLAVVLGAVFFTIARFDEDHRLAQIAASELRYAEVARERTEKDFESAEGDLRIIANMDELLQYVESGDAAYREKVEHYFLLLSRGRQHYDQIRYLDADGREDIRIRYEDGKPVTVSRQALRKRSEQRYFRAALELDRNDIYVSPVDLNVERERLKPPYKPEVRFATPVFDHQGRKRGVVVLNYIADEMLQHFRQAMQGSQTGNGMLLNSDGFWLSSPERGDEWGFMLGRPDRTFGHDYPEAWRTISTSENGTLQTVRGLFSFTTARPLQADVHHFADGSGKAVSGRNTDYYWKIVSFVPGQMLSAGAFYNTVGGRVLIASAYLLLTLVIFGIVLPVTARQKRAEETIREMAQLVEEVPGPVMRIDQSGTIGLANTASKQLYGPDDVEGISVFSAIPGLDENDFAGMFGPDQKVIRMETTLDRADYFFVLRSGPARKYVFAYGTDITPIKLLEEQVRQAQKMEVVGQLAGGVAHDFNTLLGVILGYGEMLRESFREDGLSRSNIESILDAGKRAKALVNQLMDFSRLGTAEQEPVQLAPLLSSTIRLLRPSISEKISIRQEIREKNGMVTGNAVQLEQVIMNLCMNGADAIGDGEGELLIGLKQTEVDAMLVSGSQVPPGPYLQLTVTDNGCGMDRAAMQHLFEPFFTTKEVGRGTGLGLAVVHGIIEDHGGFVQVESERGKGSSFHVYLPRIRA